MSLVWSVCGALALAALLATGLMTLVLLQTGGRSALTETEAALCNELTGVDVAAAETAGLGLRPLVWAARDTTWEAPSIALYSVPVFQSNLGALVTLLLCGVLLAVAFRGLLVLARRSALHAGLEVATRLRRSLHRQALRVGPGNVLESDPSNVIELFADNAERVGRAITNRIYVLGSATSQIAVIFFVALLVDWRVSVQCVIPLACCWYLFVRFRQRSALHRIAAEASLQDELTLLSQGFAKTRIIRGYGMENSDHRQFQQDLDDYHRHVRQLSGKRDWERWQVCLMACVAALIVLFFVGNKLLQSNGPASFSFAAAVLVTMLTGLPYLPIKRLTNLRQDWNVASPAAEEIYRYIDRIPEVSQAVGAKFLQPLATALQFEAVTCEIPGRGRVLDGIDMKLPAGQIYAFVSLDPLQSHTLAYLLPRFIEPKSGRVLVDGNDIAWVTLESLRAETAYAGGRDPILTGTVLENLRCGNAHRSLQDVTDAAKTVHAHKFISRLPMGYETRLGHMGHRLDPGESFRLSLARALLSDPALLIIEEPAEPLDADTKALLDDAYNRILRGRTVIFLPSRLSTVRRADGIVVLHDGKVAAVGKHKALVSSSPVYRHWEYSRFNEFRNGGDS